MNWCRRSTLTVSLLPLPIPICPPGRSRSAAELEGGVGDGARGGDEVGEGDALVRGGPFLVDADVARAVLHGGNACLLEDVAVADIAETAPAAHHRLRLRGAALTLGERGHQGMAPRHIHGILAPALPGARGRPGQP